MTTRIITEPAVYLIGRQTIDDTALGRFLADHDAEGWETDTDIGAEKLVEIAGRCCYFSFSRPRPGGNRAYMDHILEVGHGSVLEHAVFNLIITGVSRSFTHELVRHRAGFGFSQLSQRYVDESECAFVVPDLFREEIEVAREYVRCKGGNVNMASLHIQEDYDDDPITKYTILVGLAWLKCVECARSAYGFLADAGTAKLAHIEDKTARRKKAREAARSVLPNATETKIFVTANARALRHFIEMRASEHADAEIRRVAVAVLKLLQAEAPNLFSDYTLIDLPDGSQAATTQYRKV